MSQTYWPNAQYMLRGAVKRHNTKSGFPTFAAALSKLNSWHKDIPLLWAWIDVKEGNTKLQNSLEGAC